MPMLQNGDVFPEVKIPAAGGGSLVIPGDSWGFRGFLSGGAHLPRIVVSLLQGSARRFRTRTGHPRAAQCESGCLLGRSGRQGRGIKITTSSC